MRLYWPEDEVTINGLVRCCVGFNKPPSKGKISSSLTDDKRGNFAIFPPCTISW